MVSMARAWATLQQCHEEPPTTSRACERYSEALTLDPKTLNRERNFEDLRYLEDLPLQEVGLCGDIDTAAVGFRANGFSCAYNILNLVLSMDHCYYCCYYYYYYCCYYYCCHYYHYYYYYSCYYYYYYHHYYYNYTTSTTTTATATATTTTTTPTTTSAVRLL